jgi:hypothetical protein
VVGRAEPPGSADSVAAEFANSTPDRADIAEVETCVGDEQSGTLAGMPERDELTPAQRSLRARIAAHTSWANTENRSARTAAARAAMMDRFEKQVDPDGTMPPAERAKRAENARKAHYLAMAAKSAEVRRRRSAGR